MEANSDNQTVIVTGSQTLGINHKIENCQWPPSKHEIKLQSEHGKAIECSSNSNFTFVLFENQNKYEIDVIRLENERCSEVNHKYIELAQIDQNLEFSSAKLFCSENYLFCFIIRTKNNEKQFTGFLIPLKIDENENKNVNSNNPKQIFNIIGTAIDYNGDNDNFAYFIFTSDPECENVIFEYNWKTIRKEGWYPNKYRLSAPNTFIQYYNNRYIRLSYYDGDLYLISLDQRSMRKVTEFEHSEVESKGATFNVLSNVYSFNGFGTLNFYKEKGEEKCKLVKLDNNNMITFDENEKCGKYIRKFDEVAKLFNDYGENKSFSTLARKKKSCCFLSSAYIPSQKKDVEKADVEKDVKKVVGKKERKDDDKKERKDDDKKEIKDDDKKERKDDDKKERIDFVSLFQSYGENDLINQLKLNS